MAILNLYEDIRSNLHFNKFQIGDLLFAEYTCPIRSDTFVEQNYVALKQQRFFAAAIPAELGRGRRFPRQDL